MNLKNLYENLPGSRVLVIDDEKNLANSIERKLHLHKVEVFKAHSGQEGFETLGAEQIDAIFLDLHMPEMDGLQVMEIIREKWPEIPVIMMTGFATIESAVKAMRVGAFDFIQKPFESEELIPVMLSKAIQHRILLNRYKSLQKEVEDRYRFDNLIGKSKIMQDVFRNIERISHSESNVLITGDSGTGKELIARAIHYNSPRRKTSFVAVDLGALTENVIESELFGHVKGSFTGAVTDHKGLFRTAEGGTIFLDEIGEIPLKVQARLLRVIQEREIKPVGSSQTLKVDARVISATNRNLENMIHEGSFREDLYYRLRVVPLSVPPLRSRRDDIPLLIQHFAVKHSSANHKIRFSQESIDILSRYGWPGNVRELENMVQRLMAFSGDVPMITPAELPLEFRAETRPLGDTSVSFEDYEKMALKAALDKAGGDINEAAEFLGIGKSTMYRKLKSHGINVVRKNN